MSGNYHPILVRAVEHLYNYIFMLTIPFFMDTTKKDFPYASGQ